MNGANSHVLSSLVWFREPPSPRPLLVFWKPSSWIFFPYAGESTSPSPFYIYYYIEFPRVSIKQNEKPGWKHKQKEREKVEKKGGKKSSASSY